MLLRNNFKRKILFFSYYFPPRPEIGGKRIDKICALSLKKGWESHVLTTKARSVGDPSLCSQFGNVIMHLINNSYEEASPEKKLGIFDKIVRLMKCRLYVYLDVFRYSLIVLRIVLKNDIAVLFSTFPSYNILISSLLVKKMCKKLTWIVDFRDPWFIEVNLGFGISQTLSKIILRQILTNADVILGATHSILHILEKSSGYSITHKCLLVPNSLDITMYDNVAPLWAYHEDRIIIGHLGDLEYAHRNPEPLLQALSSLHNDVRRTHDDVEIHFWGKLGTWNGCSLLDLIHHNSLDKIVTYNGVVDHGTAMRIIKGLDILILFAFNQPLQIPAKTYEYLLSSKPILAFCENGSETYKLLEGHHGVTIVTSSDINSVKAGLIHIISKFKTSNNGLFERNMKKYDYNEVFVDIFTTIDKIIDSFKASNNN